MCEAVASLRFVGGQLAVCGCPFRRLDLRVFATYFQRVTADITTISDLYLLYQTSHLAKQLQWRVLLADAPDGGGASTPAWLLGAGGASPVPSSDAKRVLQCEPCFT